jgi:hypothetical protein
MKYKVLGSSDQSLTVDAADEKRLSEALAGLTVKILRTKRGRFVLDTGDDPSVRTQLVERLSKSGISTEEMIEFSAKPVLGGPFSRADKKR